MLSHMKVACFGAATACVAFLLFSVVPGEAQQKDKGSTEVRAKTDSHKPGEIKEVAKPDKAAKGPRREANFMPKKSDKIYSPEKNVEYPKGKPAAEERVSPRVDRSTK
jgi:hypothetical protein